MYPVENTIVTVETKYGQYLYALCKVGSFANIKSPQVYPSYKNPRITGMSERWEKITYTKAIKYAEVGKFKEAIEATIEREIQHAEHVSRVEREPSGWGDCGGGIAHWR